MGKKIRQWETNPRQATYMSWEASEGLFTFHLRDANGNVFATASLNTASAENLSDYLLAMLEESEQGSLRSIPVQGSC